MMISLMRNRGLALVVTIWITFFLVSPATAALIPSQGSSPQAVAKDIDTIQRALEVKLVQEKLQAYGLSAGEVKAKLAVMTPEQLHMLAQASDDVLAGGDGIGFIIGVLVIIILVIVILKLMGKDIRISELESPAGSALSACV